MKKVCFKNIEIELDTISPIVFNITMNKWEDIILKPKKKILTNDIGLTEMIEITVTSNKIVNVIIQEIRVSESILIIKPKYCLLV